jgi:hypothetical protein
MKSLSNKLSLNPKLLVLLWVGMLFGTGIVFFLLYVLLTNYMDINIHNWSYGDSKIAIPIFLAYILVAWFWNNATYRRSDFIRETESMGVRITKRLFYPSLMNIVGVYSFSCGYLDNIYLVAKLDLPFFAYAPFPRISAEKSIRHKEVITDGQWVPGYIMTESQIELYSLIDGLQDSEIEIIIDKEKKIIPDTALLQVNSILKTSLKNIEEFHAKLILSKGYMKMNIIGGSWLGVRFGERIKIGIELFKRLNDELKIKYPVNSWDDYEVKWDKKNGTFYIQKKTGN